ncbi:hypothetical protein GCM10011506_04950 [Marivirga lumbricoides]|uniref:Uncharacterized protein n=2 Tax=Marivirga lumbricoides TaxID=1046115 RepID=A0ABQ1LFW4_9BACT|nr:hypothetical protein GCM10011506_04950 [Marivirga lumbricoides]
MIALGLGLSTCFAQDRIQVKPNKNMELLGMMYTIVYENPENPRYDTHNPDWEYGNWLLGKYGKYGESKTIH